ncbi:PepSY-associated TM helix domain-containing protein [Wenyingzhuangia sp. IMCC45574]
MRITKSLLRKKRRKETWFKYITSLLHLWLGLLSSVVVFTVCITGSIYTFKNQIIDAINYKKVYVKPLDKHPLSLDSIQAIFKEKNLAILQITIPNAPNKSIQASYKNNTDNSIGSYYINPYSGEILGNRDSNAESFFSTVLSLHKSLLLSSIGKQIVGVAILIFVLLLISGLVLWLPKKLKWKQLKKGLLIKWNARFYRLNYDLHNTLGFYFILILFLISVTGLYVSYPWVKSGLIVAMGGNPILTADAGKEANTEIANDFKALLKEMLEKENEKTSFQNMEPVSLENIYQLANKKLPYKAITTISLPTDEETRFVIKKLNRENWLKALLPDKISFDKAGEFKKIELFKDKPLNKQFVAISLPLHTGEILGLPSLIFYFLACLVGTSLPITGFIIWWRKTS